MNELKRQLDKERNQVLARIIAICLTCLLALITTTIIVIKAPPLFGWLFSMFTWFSWTRRPGIQRSFEQLLEDNEDEEEP